jgi:hypothetical protein
MSGKTPCSFLRNNPMGHFTQKCRAVTRSPVDFREGRRASDGLVAQGILSQVDNTLSSVAFNSQRLHEACKAKGVLELHLLQQEAAQLTSQYQSSVPPDEMNVRQMQHSQFHITPIKTAGDLSTTTIALLNGGGSCYKNGGQDCSYFNKTVSGITSDINTYVGMMKNDLAKHDNGDLSSMKHITMKGDSQQATSSLQKPPLQQQLMQHRLLQQKRQTLLQKQGAMETGLTGLSRRQMLRQQSYKIAQTQQILPPLPFPLSESESEDLLAFQQIVENPSTSSPSSSLMNSPKLLKTTHLYSNNGNGNSNQPSSLSPSLSPQPNQSSDSTGIWNNLSNNLQSSCQISEASTANTHDLFHQPLYHQVFYYR